MPGGRAGLRWRRPRALTWRARPGPRIDLGGRAQVIERPHTVSTEGTALGLTHEALPTARGWAVLAAALLFVVAALASGLIQHAPLWSAAPLAPKLERISPMAGAKRLFALRSLVEFGKGLGKIVPVAAAAVVLLWPAPPRVVGAIGLEAGAVLCVRRRG